MNQLTERDWELLEIARGNIKALNNVTYQQAHAMLNIIDNLMEENKEGLIERVKINYDVTLVNFRVYSTPEELFNAEKENLSDHANEASGEDLAEENNVFVAEGKWIYAVEWHDVEYDD